MVFDQKGRRRELRILVNAYTCNPYQGSEHAVGWGYIQELAQRHRLCVIAEDENCREGIDRYLEEFPQLRERVEFHFIRKKRQRLLRKVWPPSYYRYYRRWHKAAYELAAELHARESFDLVHQLTMVGFREPGYMWMLGVPFVWGPIGGMGAFPARFMPMLGAYGCAYYVAYNILNAWQERFSWRPRVAARLAGSGLIAATPADQRGTMKHWKAPSHLIAEVGLPSPIRERPAHRAVDEPLRVVWSGLHIPRKALPLGLKALAKLPGDVNWSLDILGYGSESIAWRRLAASLGIESRCHFHGWIDRQDALDVMNRAHVMLITSLRDLTSTVTVEALSKGLPVVCLDHCGFSAAIDDSCGIKVPVTTPKSVTAGIRDALLALNDEALRIRLALGALERARAFDWRVKVDQLEEIYSQALEAGTQ